MEGAAGGGCGVAQQLAKNAQVRKVRRNFRVAPTCGARYRRFLQAGWRKKVCAL